MMPHLDGLETLRALAARPRPRVIVVCMADSDSEQALAALAAGAVDVVRKPTALATDRLYELANELVFKVRAAAQARPTPILASLPTPQRSVSPHYRGAFDLLVVGASTGGPQAITRLLRGLPADFPCRSRSWCTCRRALPKASPSVWTANASLRSWRPAKGCA